MKISDMKNEFITKSKELSAEYGYPNTQTSIGTLKMVIDCNGKEVWLKKEDKTIQNHYLISVIERYLYGVEFSDKDKEFLKKQFKLAMDYWNAHARKNNMSGIILYTPRDTKNLFIKTVQNEFPVAEHLTGLLHYEITNKCSSGYKFMGGILGIEYVSRMETYQRAIKILNSALASEPLLVLPTIGIRQSLDCMFNSGLLKAEYAGDTFYFQFNETFDKLKITYPFSNSHKTGVEMDLTEEAIKDALEEIKEENKMLLLIKQPMNSFKRLAHEKFFFKNDDNLKVVFDDLVDELGTWEEVEVESTVMYKDENIEKIHDLSDDITRRHATLYRVKTNKRIYYVAKTKQTEFNIEETLKIFISNQEITPKEAKQYVFDFMLDEQSNS